METNQLIDVQTAGAILDEVSQAAHDSETVLAEDAGIAPSPKIGIDDAQRQAQIAKLQGIARARRQREQGVKELRRAYTGVMSVRRDVQINDPVVASTLQRYFGLIDRFYLIIGRRGPDLMGVEATEKCLSTIDERIAEFAMDIKRESDAVQSMLAGDMNGGDFVQPEYMTSAAQEVVFAKHRKTLDLLDAIIAADKLLEGLNVMAWNGKVDLDKVEDVRFRIKKQVARIFTFGAGTMRGLMRRLAPKAAAPGSSIPQHERQDSPASDEPMDLRDEYRDSAVAST